MIELKNGLIVPSPVGIMLFLTQDCQLRCTYCFEDHRKDEVISLEVAKKAVDYVVENAKNDGYAPTVTLFGGEPLLVWDDIIVPLVTYIRENYDKFNINMTTNGLLLTKEKLLFLQENNITFMLSIDGAKNGNDRTRRYSNNRSVFADLEPIIDMILDIAPMTPFRMTVTPDNVDCLFESVEWFHRKGVNQLRAFPDVYVEWPEASLQILDEQLKLYNEYIYNTFTNGDPALIFDIYVYMFKKILINQYEIETDKYREAFFCQTCNRCGIGMLGNFMCNAYGDIFTCDRYVIRDESNPCYVGNIYDGISSERIDALFELCNSEDLHSATEDCKKCPLDHVCSGGCIPVNYQITGSFTSIPKSYCKYNQVVYKNVELLLDQFETEKTCDSFRDYFQTMVRKELRHVG